MAKVIPFLLKFLSYLPLSLLYGLAWLLYILLFYVFAVRKKLTLDNIQKSFPQKSKNECKKLAKQHYKSAAMVIIETVKSLSISKEEIKKRVEFKNLALLEKYLDQNQSVIVVSAHYCNMEWSLLACAQHLSYPVDTVYRVQKVEWLEKMFYQLRTRFGITPLSMESCVIESMKRAKITRVLAMAADQSPKKNDTPYWQTFLHRETAFHTGTEKITRAFKYPIIFMSMKRKRRGYYTCTLKLLAEPPFADQANDIMQKYIRELEDLVLETPEDWLWAYRRWKLQKPASS